MAKTVKSYHAFPFTKLEINKHNNNNKNMVIIDYYCFRNG